MSKSKEKRQVLTDDDIQKFKVIVNFISDLSDIFGDTNDSIEMYNILLEKTGLTNYTAIRKNIIIFSEFLEQNKNEIEKKNLENINGSIKYSDNIILNIKNILQSTDNDNRNEIWNHLNVLYSVIIDNNSNIITSTNNIGDIITTNTNENTNENTTTNINENNVFSNIVGKISENVQNETSNDPGQIMQNMMQSGVFNELVTEMNDSLVNGDLDIGKMLGSLQNMLGNNNL